MPSILQQWKREAPSLSLWLPNEILYLWHPALSPRTKPPLRHREAGRVTPPWRLVEVCPMCRRDLFPALTGRFFSRWADGFSNSWGIVPASGKKKTVYFNSLWQVISRVCFELRCQLLRGSCWCLKKIIPSQNVGKESAKTPFYTEINCIPVPQLHRNTNPV